MAFWYKNRDDGLTALLALSVGAVAMGISPIFVRLADIHPFSSAFLRLALALPLLWLLTNWPDNGSHNNTQETTKSSIKDLLLPIFGAGFFFAGDLFCWHLAIMKTSVANATFFATLAPIWVALGSGVILGEPVVRRVFYGLGLCLIGGLAISGASLEVDYGSITGDAFGFATSFFFGSYLLLMRRLRRNLNASKAIFYSTSVSAILLGILVFALELPVLPITLGSWLAVLALAIVSQVGGQGLAAYSIGHLPAAFSSLIIFIEAVAAALFGWLILGEDLVLLQWIGGILILLGVYQARPRRARSGA